MTPTRAMIGVVAIGLLIAAGIRWAGEEEASVEGPAPLPMDETVSQVLPGPDGEPEVWTLRKREATAAEQAESGLPAPSPRESAEDRRTESARTLNAQALEAWKHGELRTALERFEAAVEQDPDDWLPRSDYGRLLVMMTDYGKAATHLERSAELNPSDPRVWLDLHSYYQRTLQLELALDARERAIELAGGRAIVQDRSGLWRLEDDSIFP